MLLAAFSGSLYWGIASQRQEDQRTIRVGKGGQYNLPKIARLTITVSSLNHTVGTDIHSGQAACGISPLGHSINARRATVLRGSRKIDTPR